jgi:WD40 repeat protein
MRSVFRTSAAIAAVVMFALALLSRTAVAETTYAVSFTTGELISYDSADPANTKTTLLPGGSLLSPGSMAMGPDGNLYIGENGNGSTFAPRISKYEPATLTLSTVYPFASFEVFPGSLVFQGNSLLIGRNPFYGNTGPIVKMTNVISGTPAVSDYTTGGSLASSPGLALASDGQLYVSDQTYNFTSGIASGPVKRFDAAGTYVGEVIADGASGLAGPTGLAISGNTLYTASIMSGTILQTDLTTDITTAFATTGSPFEVGPLALLSDGSLLAGSPSGNGNIYQFGTDGTLLSTFASGLGQVGGISTVSAVPEPGTLGLAAIGIVAGGLWLRQRRRVEGARA